MGWSCLFPWCGRKRLVRFRYVYDISESIAMQRLFRAAVVDRVDQPIRPVGLHRVQAQAVFQRRPAVEGARAAWYRNRWVRTDSFNDDFPLYNIDGTRNLRASVANTHIVNHAGKTLALVESSLPYEMSNDLETLGSYDFGGKLVDSMTAHPKICPRTGDLHFGVYGSSGYPFVTY